MVGRGMRDLGRLEVVRQGSFSAAADVLGLSQSAVSQQVMALERDLEVELMIALAVGWFSSKLVAALSRRL
jgi:hypothetical protein